MGMNAKEFFDLVVDLRLAQKEFFKTRNPRDLNLSKTLEKRVDDEIERVRRLQKEPELNFGNV